MILLSKLFLCRVCSLDDNNDDGTDDNNDDGTEHAMKIKIVHVEPQRDRKYSNAAKFISTQF